MPSSSVTDDIWPDFPRAAQRGAAAPLTRELDFKLKKLSYQARTGKLVGVRLVNGVLIISQQRTKVPKAKVEAAKWLILDPNAADRYHRSAG